MMRPELGVCDELPADDQSAYQGLLSEAYEHLPPYLTEETLWSPYVHSPEEYDRLIALQSSLQTGCLALIEAFPEDERLQRLLAPRFNEVDYRTFADLSDIPLEKQFIRPDYIYDRSGRPRICEINARFIFNGNIAAVHMAEYLSQLYDISTEPYKQLDEFMHHTYDGDGRLSDITMVAVDTEPPHDLMLQAERAKQYLEVSPDVAGLLDAKKIGRLVLELHQHELEPVFGDIAGLVREGVPIYNDPRVVSFLHDKRLLVALSDETYMSKLIGEAAASVLAAGIVPSYHPEWPGREPEELPTKSALAKGAISGKGDSLHVVRLATYSNQLEVPEQFVYQERLPQPALISAEHGKVEIAGTLPMTLQEEVFGPGIVRILPHHRLHGFLGFTIAVKGND